MKIATFNINNVNRRLPNLVEWLDAADPDIVCLQELKCTDAQFPAEAIRKAGYHAVWRGQRTWNGVAILARATEPIVTRMALPGGPQDDQSRYIEAAVGGILVGCLYLPNGNPQPGPKFDYKLAWFKRLHAHARKLLKEDVPVILAGDYNVAPTELDIYPTTSWDDDALVHPESRAAYARLVKQGWVDALRELHPDERIYTFWHYLRNRWQRNAGLRLDHLLLSPAIAPLLKDAGVDRPVRGKPGASDHAPVWISLKAARRRSGPRGRSQPPIRRGTRTRLRLAVLSRRLHVPAPIADIAYQNKRVIYDLLFRASAETTLMIAADPKHLGAKIAITSVLHTWGSAMTHHPHVHMIESADASNWIACQPNFFLPVRVLSRLFRLPHHAGGCPRGASRVSGGQSWPVQETCLRFGSHQVRRAQARISAQA